MKIKPEGKKARTTLHVAVVQMQISDSIKQSLEKAKRFFDEAVQTGAELIVLPENFVGFTTEQKNQLINDRALIDYLVNTLSEWAKTSHVFLCAGTIPWLPEKHSQEKPYATSLVFSPTGRIVSQYNKIHLFDACLADKSAYHESDDYISGDALAVFDLPPVTIGLSVCFDLRYPELYKQMAGLGATAFVVPAAFTYQTGKKHWRVLLQARAIEQQSFVIAANQTSRIVGKNALWGHSMIISPDGEVLSELGREEGIASAIIDKAMVTTVRSQIPLKPFFK